MSEAPFTGSFEDSWRVFVESGRRQTPASLRTSRSGLERLFDYLAEAGVEDLRQATHAHVVGYVRWLQTSRSRRGAPLSPRTVWGLLSLVRVFFAVLQKRGLILVSPARHVFIRKPSVLPRRVMSVQEASRLIGSTPEETAIGLRDRALLELLYGTGIRLMECCRLDLGDLDHAQHSLLIRSGKGRKDRVVPLLGASSAALDRYLREARPELARHPEEPALFLSEHGRRLGPSGIQRVVVRHARGAGIPGPVWPHALRHACATHLLRGGAGVRHVQELLGHTRIATTALYTRVDPGDLRRVVEKSHPRDRAKPRS